MFSLVPLCGMSSAQWSLILYTGGTYKQSIMIEKFWRIFPKLAVELSKQITKEYKFGIFDHDACVGAVLQTTLLDLL